jgi:hypothetical protein
MPFQMTSEELLVLYSLLIAGSMVRKIGRERKVLELATLYTSMSSGPSSG